MRARVESIARRMSAPWPVSKRGERGKVDDDGDGHGEGERERETAEAADRFGSASRFTDTLLSDTMSGEGGRP